MIVDHTHIVTKRQRVISGVLLFMPLIEYYGAALPMPLILIWVSLLSISKPRTFASLRNCAL